MSNENLDVAEIRAEIKRVESKLLASDDPDISGALELKLKQLRDSLPAEKPIETSVEEVIEPPTPMQLQQAENLIRLANVEKIRGNKQKSAELLNEAAAVAPGSAIVLEAIADGMIERKRWRDAKSALEKAVKLDPKNASLERKFAEVVLMSATGGSIDDQLRNALRDPLLPTSSESLASARSATLLSFFIPGAGQFVLGRSVAGGIFFGGWIIMIFWLFLQQHDLKGLLGMAGLPTNVKRPDNLTVLVPIFVAAGIHLASIFQCAALAKAPTHRNYKRPEPPANLPFE